MNLTKALLNAEIEEFVRQIARLTLYEETTEHDLVDSAEVLDCLIAKARDLTGELPEQLIP